MGKGSSIEWTDHTFNPWWGCEKVSPACTRCYAEAFAKRVGQKVWGEKAPRRFFADKHWNEPHRWDIEAKVHGVRRRVFCASMADVFEAREDLNVWRERLWQLIDTTTGLDWLLLTKRPENIARMVPPAWLKDPPANVWYGTTVENQEWADKRIPALIDVPARVRFLSCEPLLGPLDLAKYFDDGHESGGPAGWIQGASPIDWVIAGGESGEGARPMYHRWPRDLRDQARRFDVSFFFKQWGAWVPVSDFDVDANDSKLYHPVPEYSDRTRRPRVQSITMDSGGPTDTFGPGAMRYFRVGKKLAGRVLDGCTWDEIPPAGVPQGQR